MNRWLPLLVVVGVLVWPRAAAWAQADRPPAECPDRSLCRYTETNLGDYSVPLMIQGRGSCAQFCSADYWVTNTASGAELLRFGHGGPMGPPLLAIGPFGPSLSGPLAAAFRLHRIQWVPSPNPQAIDDGWYEDTTYAWDAAGGVLVEGPTQRVESDRLQAAVQALQSQGLQLLLPRERW